MTKDKTPVTKKIGPRRVRTEPVPGQQDEPLDEAGASPGDDTPEAENDARLKADKPPHY